MVSPYVLIIGSITLRLSTEGKKLVTSCVFLKLVQVYSERRRELATSLASHDVINKRKTPAMER